MHSCCTASGATRRTSSRSPKPLPARPISSSARQQGCSSASVRARVHAAAVPRRSANGFRGDSGAAPAALPLPLPQSVVLLLLVVPASSSRTSSSTRSAPVLDTDEHREQSAASLSVASPPARRGPLQLRLASRPRDAVAAQQRPTHGQLGVGGLLASRARRHRRQPPRAAVRGVRTRLVRRRLVGASLSSLSPSRWTVPDSRPSQKTLAASLWTSVGVALPPEAVRSPPPLRRAVPARPARPVEHELIAHRSCSATSTTRTSGATSRTS